MIFPFLLVILGMMGVLAYFCRKNVTYTNVRGTNGSIGMAFVVFLVLALFGWGMDIYLAWSIVPMYMYVVGGTLQILAIMFFAGLALLLLSMLYSSARVGVMVA